jgi:sulfate transport system permease protein
MTTLAMTSSASTARRPHPPTEPGRIPSGAAAPPGRPESALIRRALIAVAALFVGVMIVLPLGAVLIEAFASGIGRFLSALAHPDALSAMRLTAVTAAIVVPLSTLFGVAAAWAIAKFEFPGKSALITLIDVPFSVSPVIAGMAFVLIFGARGWLGPWLAERGVQVIFSLPGIVLATAFVTVPFVARELIPLMQSQSRQEEEAALSLGAGPWRTFFRVTLPNIRHGLLFGVTLCLARSIGEFGAVSVVSGHVRGQTDTLPLHVEALYGEYRFPDAAAIATLLITFTLAAVAVKEYARRRLERVRQAEAEHSTGDAPDVH